MARQFITLGIGARRLGIEITAIREIRAWSPATPLPATPTDIVGVVNLRGVILPVTDLQQRLGWGATEVTARHVIIVLQVAGQLQGIIVHTVDDIVTLQPEQIQPVPEAGGSTAAALLEGIATVEGNLIMVLDPARLGQPANELAQAA